MFYFRIKCLLLSRARVKAIVENVLLCLLWKLKRLFYRLNKLCLPEYASLLILIIFLFEETLFSILILHFSLVPFLDIMPRRVRDYGPLCQNLNVGNFSRKYIAIVFCCLYLEFTLQAFRFLCLFSKHTTERHETSEYVHIFVELYDTFYGVSPPPWLRCLIQWTVLNYLT